MSLRARTTCDPPIFVAIDFVHQGAGQRVKQKWNVAGAGECVIGRLRFPSHCPPDPCPDITRGTWNSGCAARRDEGPNRVSRTPLLMDVMRFVDISLSLTIFRSSATTIGL